MRSRRGSATRGDALPALAATTPSRLESWAVRDGLAIFHFGVLRRQVAHFALLWIGFVVGFGPLLAYFLRYPERWASRPVQQLLIPATIPTSWNDLLVIWNVLSNQLNLNFLSLSVIPARDGYYFAPFLRPAEAVLLVLGAGVAGHQAIATARRLGAVVEGYDVRAAAGEQVKSLGATFLEVDLGGGAVRAEAGEGQPDRAHVNLRPRRRRA